jgi:hypothetical protein
MDTRDVAGIDNLRRPHASPSTANRSSREEHPIRSQVVDFDGTLRRAASSKCLGHDDPSFVASQKAG